MKPLGIVIMATGSDMYRNYACDLVNSLRHNFPAHEVLLFTDRRLRVNATYVEQEQLEWPRATLERYANMWRERERLAQFDQILFMDADMLPVTRVSMEEIRSNGITAVVHPGYPPNAFCTNPASTAYTEKINGTYYQGCLQGGKSGPFLEMCRVLSQNIDIDEINGVRAPNYDESHLNYYLTKTPPSRILPPNFAFPGAKYIRNDVSWPKMRGLQPRIRHIDKNIERVW